MASRTEDLVRLRSGETWDLLVIGGGATGLGTAVDAASRGYRTILLEADDFARGTSSRSTKLIHGGVRYLAQGNISLVREALRERGLLFRNAPHLVHDRPFLVPSYRFGSRSYYGFGMWVYDRLAGRLGIKSSRVVGREEASDLIPTLETANLRGGVLYHDGQFDDARLAVALARTVEDLGGVALNGLGVVGLLKNSNGTVKGVTATDDETGEEFRVNARVVVNATGVFADDLRGLDEPGSPPMIRPSQGAHVVLDRSFLPGVTALMVPKTDDGRVLFAIPWLGHVVVGTTDTPVAATTVEPRATGVELEFLLRHAARYLTRDPAPRDVLSVYAGLRPLISVPGTRSRRTSQLSREFAVVTSSSGLVTITGGKWTTYRKMGEAAVDAAIVAGGLVPRPCVSRSLRLHGWIESTQDGPFAPYGSDAPELARLVRDDSELGIPLSTSLPYTAVEVIWAARHERARSVEDVLARRTRALFLDSDAASTVAPRVAALLAGELGRDEAWQRGQVDAFRTLAKGYRMPG